MHVRSYTCSAQGFENKEKQRTRDPTILLSQTGEFDMVSNTTLTTKLVLINLLMGCNDVQSFSFLSFLRDYDAQS